MSITTFTLPVLTLCPWEPRNVKIIAHRCVRRALVLRLGIMFTVSVVIAVGAYEHSDAIVVATRSLVMAIFVPVDRGIQKDGVV